MVFITRSSSMPGVRPSHRNRVGPSPPCGLGATFAMMIQVRAPSAPVISHLRPLMTYSLPSKIASVFSCPGSEPAPSGSVIANTDRCRPSMTGTRNSSAWASLAILDKMNMLPSSGAAQFIATGPRVDQPAASNSTACSRWVGSQPPKRRGACTVRSLALRANSTISVRISSFGPCRVSRGSRSKGTISSATNARISSRRAARSAGISKSITQAPSIIAAARWKSRTVAVCNTSPISLGALPAAARALEPSRMMPSLKHAITAYQSIFDRSRVVFAA